MAWFADTVALFSKPIRLRHPPLLTGVTTAWTTAKVEGFQLFERRSRHVTRLIFGDPPCGYRNRATRARGRCGLEHGRQGTEIEAR